MKPKSREAAQVLATLKKSRGHVLPVHELMAALEPKLLQQYMELSQYLLFDGEPHALDLKTRFLVLVGITTAVKGDPEGVDWSSARAMKYGASREEVAEAALLAMLPAGVPAVEKVSRRLLDNWNATSAASGARARRGSGKVRRRKAR